MAFLFKQPSLAAKGIVTAISVPGIIIGSPFVDNKAPPVLTFSSIAGKRKVLAEHDTSVWYPLLSLVLLNPSIVKFGATRIAPPQLAGFNIRRYKALIRLKKQYACQFMQAPQQDLLAFFQQVIMTISNFSLHHDKDYRACVIVR